MNGASGSSSSSDKSDEYLLLVHDETNVKDYSLKFSGSKRILQVRYSIDKLNMIVLNSTLLSLY